MSFDIREVTDTAARSIKKYPWIIGVGIAGIAAAYLMLQKQSDSDPVRLVESYPENSTTTASGQTASYADSLAGISENMDSSLSAMGDIIAGALESNQIAISAALADVVADCSSITNTTDVQPYNTDIQPFEPVVTHSTTQSSPSPSQSPSQSQSSQSSQSPSQSSPSPSQTSVTPGTNTDPVRNNDGSASVLTRNNDGSFVMQTYTKTELENIQI